MLAVVYFSFFCVEAVKLVERSRLASRYIYIEIKL